MFFLKEGTKYSFIVLDPPWLNKSVRRKRPYNWLDFNDIKNLPIEYLIDRTRSTLICCWSTNCDKIEEFIKNDLFNKWNCQYLTTWYWLKVCLRLFFLQNRTFSFPMYHIKGEIDHHRSTKNFSYIHLPIISYRDGLL